MNLEEFFDQLIRFETELWDLVEAKMLQDQQLPMTWFEPMNVIKTLEICRVQEISRTLSITVGGASKLIDRIEKAGYCRRISDTTDKRASLLELTPSGEKKLKAAKVTFNRILEFQLGSTNSISDLQQFYKLLRKIRSNLMRPI